MKWESRIINRDDFFFIELLITMTKKSVLKRWATISNLMKFDLENRSMRYSGAWINTNEERAVIYCRVSDTSQVTNGFGLEWQERVCREWCQNQSPQVAIDKVFIEPWISGATTKREQFDACMKYLEEQNKKYLKITHFVVSEASRISRPDDIAEAFMMEAAIKSTGVKIISLDMPGIDESTDEGHLFKTLQYAIAWYERKKIKKRAMNGKVSRIKDGFRPFWKSPVGYLRKRSGTKDYHDEIDPVKWPIIKRGLELFASDVLMSQTDLYNYWVKEGLTTNAKKFNGLQKTFPWKVFRLHRLFFYWGYMLYPDWGINKPIKGNHTGLISLSTVYQIIKKLKAQHKSTNKIKLKCKKMSKEHPLRWIIECNGCWRKFTSWNTAKYRTKKDGTRVKKLYPYYGCNNPKCKELVNVRKETLENEFAEMLNQIKVSDKLKDIINYYFNHAWQQHQSSYWAKRELQKKEILKMKAKQEQLESTMIRTTNDRLYRKLEEEWEKLEKQISESKQSLETKIDNEKRMNSLLQKTVKLFENPQEIREKGSNTMKELLIKVRFSDQLKYVKDQWLQTKQTAVLYKLMLGFNWSNSVIREAGQKTQTLDPKFFDQLTQTILDQSEAIRLATKRLEYEWLINEWIENLAQNVEPP